MHRAPSSRFPNLGSPGRIRAAVLATLLAALAPGTLRAATPIGLDALGNPDALPLLREQTRLIQFSSYDRTGEPSDANDDRNTWLRRDEHGDYVLYEDAGPGCVYRIWMTWSQTEFVTNNRIRIYFDGEAIPRVDRNVGDFFSGTNAPFVRPFVGDKASSAGGMYCLLPFPYARGCRIATTWFPPESERPQHWPANWGYYQITGHRFASTNGVTTWTGLEDAGRVTQQWARCGVDPKSATGTTVAAGSVDLAAGSTTTVFTASGSGCIASLRLDPEPHDAATLAAVRLIAQWDDEPVPAVDAPLGAFFGSAFGETTATALMTGMRTGGWYACHFPMPFWTNAAIRLVHTGTQAVVRVDYTIAWGTNGYDRARAGRFHARHAQREMPGDGSDFAMLDIAGRGHIVGLHLAATSSVSSLAFLEMDDRLFLDGAGSPAAHGTGAEDYFNGGWYWLGVTNLCLPLHGLTAAHLVNGQPGNWAAAYRHQLGDVVPFESSARFLMEVVPAYTTSSRWESVVFYYALPGTNAGLVRCAATEAGDPAAEAAAGWTATAAAAPLTNAWRYPGRQPFADETDAGRSITGAVEFAVPLSVPNAGIVLRRRMDAGIAGQRAEVRVDGRIAGTWDAPDGSFSNSANRWCDAEFLVPPAFTAGKTGVVVHIERDASTDAPWTDYRDEAFAIVPPDRADDADLDGLPDVWEVLHFGWAGGAEATGDPDGDGQPNGDECIADTDPTNGASFFAIAGAAINSGGLAIQAASNRIYRVQRATDLAAGDWADNGGAVTGAGSRVDLPIAPGAGGFFRVRAARGE